ncbi:MAG: 3-dehydroquinate synthase [Pseudomonadota bacterium]
MIDSPQTVHVELGERSYDILIGPDLLSEAASLIHKRLGSVRSLIVTDTNVASAHLGTLETSMRHSNMAFETIILDAGERSKSWEAARQVTEAILDAKLERADLVIALGGGVVGDLAGFASAIARRGTRFVQIPTSLLAQVDSSVGGKTGINTHHGKNLVGAFHQPALVLADIDVLETLPERQMRAGYAEIVKYALINDHAFFEWLEAHAVALLNGDQDALTYAISTSCDAKARIVAQDERESGTRALLNLGHTFGHALESLTGYDADRLVHGEAVSIGIAMAHQFSHHLGFCPGQDVHRVLKHLEALNMPSSIIDIPNGRFTPEELVEAMRQDKKVSRGALTFILTRGIGRSFIANQIDEGALTSFLSQALQPA